MDTMDIRKMIAALGLTVCLDGEAADEVSREAIAEMNRLAALLQARRHACFLCAFGIWEKSPQCEHP